MHWIAGLVAYLVVWDATASVVKFNAGTVAFSSMSLKSCLLWLDYVQLITGIDNIMLLLLLHLVSVNRNFRLEFNMTGLMVVRHFIKLLIDVSVFYGRGLSCDNTQVHGTVDQYSLILDVRSAPMVKIPVILAGTAAAVGGRVRTTSVVTVGHPCSGHMNLLFLIWRVHLLEQSSSLTSLHLHEGRWLYVQKVRLNHALLCIDNLHDWHHSSLVLVLHTTVAANFLLSAHIFTCTPMTM